jgi:hypothetical protein
MYLSLLKVKYISSTKFFSCHPLIWMTAKGRKMNMVDVLAGTEEGNEMKKYLKRCITGEHSGPIGPLTIEQTKLQARRKKFLASPMNYKDMLEYRASA